MNATTHQRQRAVRIFGIGVNARTDHVGTFPRVDALANQGKHFAHQRRIVFRHHECANRLAAAGKFHQHG